MGHKFVTEEKLKKQYIVLPTLEENILLNKDIFHSKHHYTISEKFAKTFKLDKTEITHQDIEKVEKAVNKINQYKNIRQIPITSIKLWVEQILKSRNNEVKSVYIEPKFTVALKSHQKIENKIGNIYKVFIRLNNDPFIEIMLNKLIFAFAKEFSEFVNSFYKYKNKDEILDVGIDSKGNKFTWYIDITNNSIFVETERNPDTNTIWTINDINEVYESRKLFHILYIFAQLIASKYQNIGTTDLIKILFKVINFRHVTHISSDKRVIESLELLFENKISFRDTNDLERKLLRIMVRNTIGAILTTIGTKFGYKEFLAIADTINSLNPNDIKGRDLLIFVTIIEKIIEQKKEILKNINLINKLIETINRIMKNEEYAKIIFFD